MNPITGILLAASLQAGAQAPQAAQAVERYLAARPPAQPTSNPVEFKVGYDSFRKGKPSGTFRDSGRLLIGTTEKGAVWVGSLQEKSRPEIGEVPPSEGKRWFSELCGPSRMTPFADPGAFLASFLRQLPLKAVEPPPQGTGGPGDQVLVFRLEAPRPEARFWRFKSTAGEARLHVRSDGAPVSLMVTQAYHGSLNPHFGRYTLDRREKWTFQPGAEGAQVKQYQLRLQRQDWKESLRAEVEMARGDLP